MKGDWLSKFAREGIYTDTILHYWIDVAPGAFHIGMFAKDPEAELIYISKCEQLVEQGVLNRWGSKRGWYIPRKLELAKMDYVNANDDPVDIWLPFELSDLVELFDGNVVVIAGAPNAGKTSLLLNIIKENILKGWDIHYFNSEMGEGELKKRLLKFDYIALQDWKFKAYERAEDFQDVIIPGKNSLNLIDFLEVHDEFYIIGRRIKEIHDRLKGGLAIIALQKNPGSDQGLGGFRSLEVTRLALSIDFGRVKIVKAKNFKQPNVNPNGLCKNFKILHGSQLISLGNWYKETSKEKSKGKGEAGNG